MRICTTISLAVGLLFQVGCVSLLTPTATPARLKAYNEELAQQYVAANDLERQGMHRQAREIYLELHEKHPANPDYLHRLAVVNTRLQRNLEAAKYYEQARQANPKNVRLLADIGYFSYLRKNLPAAEEALREALRLKPTDRRAINNLALVLGSQGRMEECLDVLKQSGNEAEALEGLAYIHATRGETDLAESRYRQALAIDPNRSLAARALAEITERRDKEEVVLEAPPAFANVHLEPVVPDAEPDTEFEPEIEQVAAEFDSKSTNVVTAGFEKLSFDYEEPQAPNTLAEAEEPSNDQVILAISFDEPEPETEKEQQQVPVQEDNGFEENTTPFDADEAADLEPVSSEDDDDWSKD